LKRGELSVTKLPPSPTLPSQNPALPRRGFSFFVELKGMPDYWVFQDKLDQPGPFRGNLARRVYDLRGSTPHSGRVVP